MADKGIPSWPKVTIRLYDDRNAEVKIAGTSHQVNNLDPRQAAISLIAERAGQLGRPVRVTATEANGRSWPLIVHPDGDVEAVDEKKTADRSGKPLWPIIAAAALVVVVGGTLLYLFVLKGDPEQTTTKPPAAAKLPALPEPNVGPDQFSARPVPPGWATNANWTVDIAEGSHPAVSPDGSQVAIITRDEKLAVFDSSGKVLWQDKVPKESGSPAYTTVDGKSVVAVETPDSLKYWAGDSAPATSIDLPDGTSVQFFGTSPLVVKSGDDGGANLVSNGKLQSVENQPRLSTMLLAEGNKALMARYAGPLFWSQPGKELVLLNLKAPAGAKRISQVVATSPGLAVALWSTGKSDEVIPAVSSTSSGAVVAACPQTKGSDAASWKWVPNPTGKVAAYGECLINLGTGKTSRLERFQPLSITQKTIFGQAGDGLVAVVPGEKPTSLPTGTARPWGIAGKRAIVVHASVLYALDPK